ncbi:hypothetical protein [Bradyrhizobium sp.]|uniref:hypothetical protein n=1 Tax=Bradyrhizobium sp. TaxID=376 RepID=UPI001C291D4F|nr:hypothetical protein [Bradyrhizobium sp.]MBU6461574.1 hypothetical protein [Pseudomonadota bacterium]
MLSDPASLIVWRTTPREVAVDATTEVQHIHVVLVPAHAGVHCRNFPGKVRSCQDPRRTARSVRRGGGDNRGAATLRRAK